MYRIVEKMRQQRPAMVQAKDQYLFVYLAVVELVRRILMNQPQPPPKPDSVSSSGTTSSQWGGVIPEVAYSRKRVIQLCRTWTVQCIRLMTIFRTVVGSLL